MKQITLLLVAGEPSVLHALRMRLELEPDFRVVAGTLPIGTLGQTVDAVEADVVVLDIDAPGGRDLLLGLLQRLASTRPVVVLSLSDEAEFVRAALEAGATAVIAKQEPTAALFAAIRTASLRGRNGKAAR